MKKLFTILLLAIGLTSFSQDVNTSDIEKAESQIVQLKENGALVVRLHLTKTNIEMYRKYGDIKTADRLQKDLENTNFLNTLAFLDSTFTFCPVYFIDSKDYGKVINGIKSGYLLGKDLKVDSSIVIKEDFLLFVDRGSVYEQVGNGKDFKHAVTSSTPVIQDALVVKDLDMNQLVGPFPFYKTVRTPGFETSMMGFFLVNPVTAAVAWYFLNNGVLSKRDLKTEIKRSNIPMSNDYIKKKKRNIATYYKKVYGLKNDELVLPFNIYRLNVKLHRYYNKVKGITSNKSTF